MSKKLIFAILASLFIGFIAGGYVSYKLLPKHQTAGISEATEIAASDEAIEARKAQEFMEKLSDAAYSIGRSRRADYTLYWFRDSFSSASGIQIQSERPLEPVLLAEDLRHILSPYLELHSISFSDAATPGRYYLRLKVIEAAGTSFGTAPPYLQQAILYCLEATLRGIPWLQGFQLCNSRGEALDSSYGVFSMAEASEFSAALSPQPERGSSQLTTVQPGEKISLKVYASQYVYTNNPDDYTIVLYEAVAAGETLEELVLKAFAGNHPLKELLSLELRSIQIYDGIAYVDFIAAEDKMSATGSAGASEFFLSLYETLRQFPQVTHAHVLFNGAAGGLHGSGRSYPISLR